MKDTSEFKETYKTPRVRIIPLLTEKAFCGSSVPGGNEDVGYDDEW